MNYESEMRGQAPDHHYHVYDHASRRLREENERLLAENLQLMDTNLKLMKQAEASKLRSVENALTAAGLFTTVPITEKLTEKLEHQGWSFGA